MFKEMKYTRFTYKCMYYVYFVDFLHGEVHLRYCQRDHLTSRRMY